MAFSPSPDFAQQTPYRHDPAELRTLIKIVVGICALYYLLFSSGLVSLHPDSTAARQAAHVAASEAGI